jgi:outer membrane protein
MVSRSNRSRFVPVLAWLMAASAPLAAQAPAQAPLRLSFADAVRLASGEVPVVALATLRTSEADARVRQARAALLPSLSLGGSWANRTFNSKSLGIDFSFPLPGGGTATLPDLIGPFNLYDARFSATQTLFDWSSVRRVRAAGAQADGSRAERGVTVEASVLTTAIAYVRAVRAQAVVGARQADSAIAAELVGLAEAQRAAGVSPAIDVTRAQAQLARAQGLLLVAKNQLDRGRIEVTRALGLDPATPLAFADSLAPSLGAADVPVQRDSAVSAALAARPELQAELARAAAARQTGSAIRAERLPRLQLAGDYGVNGRTVPNAIATRELALQVSVPILDGFRREARLDEQDAVVRESRVREADLRRQIAAEVDAALLDLGSAEAQQLVAREELRLAESELSQARERFKAGVAGNIDVITAQVGLVRARDTEIDARFAAATARISLARAAGVARTLH